MDLMQWVELFGRDADDGEVRKALADAGIAERITIKRQALSEREDLPGQGTTVVFTSETMLRPDDPAAVVGRPILSAVLVILDQANKDDLYQGPLPYHLGRSDGQGALRTRLGPPAKINQESAIDTWQIDGKKLAAIYSRDLQSLRKLTMALPGSQ